MRLVQAEIDAWEECICNNICGDIAAQSDDEDRVLVDPLTYVDDWGFHSIQAGLTLGIAGYTTNALGNYLKYDMIMADKEYSDVNAFDMFSPFTDVKYEWDDVSGSCQSFVKISQGEELQGPSDELKSYIYYAILTRERQSSCDSLRSSLRPPLRPSHRR